MEGHMPWGNKTRRLIARNLRLHFLLASVPLEWDNYGKLVKRPRSSCFKRAVFYTYMVYNAFNVFWVGHTFIQGIGRDSGRLIKSLALDLFVLAAMILWLTLGYNVADHTYEYMDALNAIFCFNPRQTCKYCSWLDRRKESFQSRVQYLQLIVSGFEKKWTLNLLPVSSYRYTRLRKTAFYLKPIDIRGHRQAPFRQMFVNLWQTFSMALKRSTMSSEQWTENNYNIPIQLFNTLTFFNGFVITICFGLLCAVDPTDDRYIWGFIWPRNPPLVARLVGFFWECFIIWHAWSCIIFHAETVLIMVCGLLEHLRDINNAK